MKRDCIKNVLQSRFIISIYVYSSAYYIREIPFCRTTKSLYHLHKPNYSLKCYTIKTPTYYDQIHSTHRHQRDKAVYQHSASRIHRAIRGQMPRPHRPSGTR